MKQEFLAHILAPSGGAQFTAAPWSPLAAAVTATDDRDAIRADYEADVDLLDAELPLSALTDRVRTGWLVAFGDAPSGTTIDDLSRTLEVRSVVRRRADIGRGTVTLTTRLLKP